MAINGTNNKDFFRGTRFDDEINGAGGDDFFHGSPGQDRLDGQSGSDSVDYSLFRYGPQFYNTDLGESVDVDLQRATQIGGFADGDILVSIENVAGSIEDDIIRGDAKANILVGNNGDDLLEGRDGDDVLISGGSGFDIGADESFLGDNGSGNDVLDGGAGNDQLFGQDGNDTLIGGAGVNKIDGGTGTDTASYATATAGALVSLTAGNGNGVALGLGANSGSDQLISIENIIGSSFADTITGSSAANVIEGGGGNDVITGGAGADALKGGTGTDTANYGGSSAVNVNLGTLSIVPNGQGGFTVTQVGGTGTGGDAEGDTLSGFENLTGSGFADTLTGNNGANRLDGGADDDTINGGGGHDIIIGGADVDIESLSGGAGFDTFVYLNRSDSNTSAVRTGDFILDFNVDQDLIDLRALGVNAANLLITNNVVNGAHFARVLEDLNGNGQADDNELSINLVVESVADVTLQDILI